MSGPRSWETEARQRGTSGEGRGLETSGKKERVERQMRPVGRRNIQMWIWRIVSLSWPSLSFVSRPPPLLSLSLSGLRGSRQPFLCSSSLPAFRSRNHRFLIIPPPCAIVPAGQSATKPTPALSARDIRQYPNERSTGETCWKGTRPG